MKPAGPRIAKCMSLYGLQYSNYEYKRHTEPVPLKYMKNSPQSIRDGYTDIFYKCRGRSSQLSVAHLVALSRALNLGEQEVADSAADRHRQTQVDVKRHEDEHQRQTEPQLDEVQQRLQPVRRKQHPE